jgi:LPPG:FO 2-phospho-L-lactate transferase
MQKITVLAAGASGARFSNDLVAGLRTGAPGAPDSVTIIANTAADAWLHGLKVSPDLDLLMHTLGGAATDGTQAVAAGLAAYGVEPAWFTPTDQEVATQLVRTQMLEAGYPLSQVTAALCRRWLTPLYAERVRLLPVTDDRVETHVAITDPEAASGRRVVHFQEYWVKLRAEVPAEALVFVGLEDSSPAPGVIDAITDADLVIVPPSNPVVSVGTILGVPRVREAMTATRARVVGLSPIVGGHHLRGMAEQLLTTIGVEVSAAGVGLHYGSRRHGGLLDGWLVDDADAGDVRRVVDAGLPCRAVPLLMTDLDATAAMAAAAVGLVA